jgi:hypothetical protein
MVTLGGRHGDMPPGDAGGFLTFAQQLRTPTLYKRSGMPNASATSSASAFRQAFGGISSGSKRVPVG